MKGNFTMHYAPLRHLHTLLLLAGFLLPAITRGQFIQSVNPTSTTAGQSITMIITGTNTNFQTVTGIYLRNGGTFNYGTNFNATSPTNATVEFTFAPNAPLGNYSLETYGQFVNYPNALNVGVGPGSAYGFVSGKVIMDNNGNCTQDGGDDAVAGRVITLNPGNYHLTTGANGDFSGWVPNGSYTATCIGFPCGSWLCPVTGNHAVNISTPLSQDVSNDFYWQPVACSDLESSISTGFLRPGFSTYVSAVFQNNGTSSVNGAVGTITMPTGLTINNIYPTPSSVVGQDYSWNLSTLNIGGYATCTFDVTVPIGTPLGTSYYFNTTFPVVGTDPNPSNNNRSLTRTVQGSFDPNDKQVWDENGEVAGPTTDPSTSQLRYLIRFQNTGTDTAFNIFVRDTLDPNVDQGTLHITGASHPYQYSLTGDRNVQFTFPNILLVDSFANEPLSHGWIEYVVDLMPGLPIGTTIENTASIYFDFNSPVVTNTTQSTLCNDLATDYSFTNTSGWTYDFTDLSDVSATSWHWDFGDGGISTQQNPTYTYANPGSYTVCLRTTSPCTEDSICHTILIVGLDHAQSIAQVDVFPNPSNGSFVLNLEAIESGSLQLRVLDMQGRCVQEASVAVAAGLVRKSIDLSGEASGLYLLEMRLNGQSHCVRLQRQ